MKIRIKKKNRGKFTALKKRTGHSASWFKAHGTPAQKKMAVFALNARKWKHGDGGLLENYFDLGGPEKQNWLTKMVLGAAMAENPAVTTASGWTRDADGNIVQTDMEDPGVRQLRNNIAVLGAGALGATAVPILPELGHAAALGIDTMGRYAMPSTFLKGVSYYVPKAAGALGAVSPWFDAGALSLWSAEAGKAAMDAKKQGRTGDAIGMGALAALPIAMPLGMKAYQGMRNGLRMKPFEIGNVSSAELYDPIVGHSTAPPEAYFAEEAARENAEIARLGRETMLAEPVDRPHINAFEWTPQELERLRAMTGDHPMNLDAYTPEQIAQAQAMMQADAPVIHDALAGNRSTAPTQTFLAAAPSVAKTTDAGYQIQRYPGYMLQSLMEGNALEKQMGKNGTVSVNNIKAMMKSAKKVDQAVVDKVLASEEFAGKKSIDYNQFRKAVQDELITYDRTPDTRWNKYGLSRLGLSTAEEPATMEEATFIGDAIRRYASENGFEWTYDSAGRGIWVNRETGSQLTPSEIRDKAVLLQIQAPELNTYTFSSSRIPRGSDRHYDANTLGHSRTYTTADEPDVLHVMESQSDWAQHYGESHNEPGLRGYAERFLAEHPELDWRVHLTRPRQNSLGSVFVDKDGNYINAFDVESKFPGWMDQVNTDYTSNVDQMKYLSDNFTSRQIQENLRYAAEKGQKKMRYPTRETAAKIEGYPEKVEYFTKEGTKVSDPWEYPDDVAQEIEELQNEIDRIDLEDLNTYAPFHIEKGAFEQRELNEKGTAKLLAALRERIIKDKDSLYQMRKYGDDNSMVEERLYNNTKLFDSEVAKYKERYGHEPALDEIMEASRRARARREEIGPRLKELVDSPQILSTDLIEKKTYSHEDILRKYTEFPKQYQKLFKGAGVRTVTDPKGNTWYEVDVPENYLQQEWKYSAGGILGKANQIYSGDMSKIRQAIQNARARQKK